MIPFHRPDLGEAEVEAVARAIRDGHVGGNGPICRRVEARLRELTGARHCLLAPSATHAMELALTCVDLRPGDEVLMPSFAFVSQANVILARGAKPVFCEIDPHTLNMDPVDAESRITERTRALMPVHYAGIACDLDAYVKLAEKHGLPLLEDAAQGLGATHRGRHLGTIGDAGFISFHATKNVVCGEGGVMLTNDETLWRRAQIVQEKGTNRLAFLRGEVDRYTWVDVGANLTMPDLSAALLEAQLSRIGEIQRVRMRLFERYDRELEPIEREGLVARPVRPQWARHNGHLYFVQARRPGLQRALLDGLRERGIEASFHFQPLHASPYARARLGPLEPLPVTERAADNLVRLPLHARMTPGDADRVCEAVTEIARAHAA